MLALADRNTVRSILACTEIFAQQISAVTQLLLSETNRPGVVGMVFAFGATDSNIGLPGNRSRAVFRAEAFNYTNKSLVDAGYGWEGQNDDLDN